MHRLLFYTNDRLQRTRRFGKLILRHQLYIAGHQPYRLAVSELPEKIAKASADAAKFVSPEAPSGNGRGVCLNCAGLIVISITENIRKLDQVGFESGGCAYMNASASVIAEKLRGLDMRSFGSKIDQISRACVETELGTFPDERSECLQGVIDAFRGAISDHSSRSVDEFPGEQALICTCFGITEDRLFAAIKTRNAADVESVADACNAGSGCGSCRMLIQEYIDAYVDESHHTS